MAEAGHRRFAAVWDWMSRHEDAKAQRLRQQVVGGAVGRTLEIGYGVGSNWRFLPEDIEYTGIEPDPYMRERAVHNLPSRRELRAVAGNAHALEFEDGTFDTVIATLVLCTIPDAARALGEFKRVLAPGGTLRFFEHVRAESRIGATVQDVVTPVWKRLGGGCHPNRDTLAAIHATGFEVGELEHVKIGPLPAIVGVAMRRTGD